MHDRINTIKPMIPWDSADLDQPFLAINIKTKAVMVNGKDNIMKARCAWNHNSSFNIFATGNAFFKWAAAKVLKIIAMNVYGLMHGFSGLRMGSAINGFLWKNDSLTLSFVFPIFIDR